ncbi:MAG: TrkH family potassium uptake protein [Candidatus Cloacimonadaceae bacterium]|jgi:trk system potassium uptake protein TrkH|nr:TrkH family potassium uptake protein [Candidatus Cloacimonadota bacterium]MDY0127752.1 TrkH family potassium uptake protein [Candidatus Cloacimonadaceae bacterium]MCB5255823.1 TrkH family potassium uptake protein [Candidatus Cloacimonadota bacterium]MCK9178078.1 TrkH family potassium uptake protein [Candidatus Cloacimonadota bacterium]MCK9242294.1 TrkH family potassium uptake protein [Candidatus Cloacimonadota bacterium]
MPEKKPSKFLKYIESIAYLLALWSFAVIFLESIFTAFTDYHSLEFFTALANLILIFITILGRMSSPDSRSKRNLLILDLTLLVLGGILISYHPKFVIFFLLIRQTYFTMQYLIFRSFEGKLYKVLTNNPPVSLMLSFAAVIIIGTVLLMLPSASVQGRVTPFMDALFTATSATCVTGLIVQDTGGYFSLFGQLVILLLIQIGGLGIMTISTAFALIMGRRLTLKLENVMQTVMGESQRLDLFQLLKNIVIVTILIEGVGAILLFPVFLRSMSSSWAMYNAIFHSVSAFCNAGFSLFSDSLISFVDNPLVNFTISTLILLGGIGFAVLIDLYRYVMHVDKVRKLTLHTKIVLTTSAALLVIGFISIYIAEYSSVMEDFSISRRILSSWFQSVTARTAGFNTVDISALGSSSLLVMMALMFIGASPGSTGGGIKTTTFAVLVLSLVSLLRGRRELSLFNRRISLSNYREATSLITLAAGIVFFIVFVLFLTEQQAFEKLLFEAISAFGTVGLSTGITSELTQIGKMLITILMYIGRIGPLTLIYALSMRNRQAKLNYAEEKIAIG